jgi:hypothetical protein
MLIDLSLYFAISMTLIVTHDTRLRSIFSFYLLIHNDLHSVHTRLLETALDEYTYFTLNLLCFPFSFDIFFHRWFLNALGELVIR